jgi:RsiW-degrading membrane proteinase PrsW (M82 family)
LTAIAVEANLKSYPCNNDTIASKPVNRATIKQLDDHRFYELSISQELTIGRESCCQVILDSTRYPSISRVHAVFRPLASGDWEICDLNSANGTVVNGQRLQGCRKLQTGDRITLGQNAVTFLFEVEAQVSQQVGQVGAPRDRNRIAPPPPRTPAASKSSANGLSISQLIPILSTGKDLRRKGYLIPGIFTVVVVVSMFAAIGNFVIFAGLLAAYLALGGFYVIYQLCGKSKPWWWLLSSAITTVVLLLTPGVFFVFELVFRRFLPGNVAGVTPGAGFFPNLVAHFFGAGMLEELFKALPILAAYFIGSWLRSPYRERLGVWEPLDGILLGAASAVGFTLLETLGQYVPGVVNSVARDAGQGAALFVGLQLLIPRILGSVAGHMAYSGYFGYFIGLSILKPANRWIILAIGYLTASGLHGFWNASSSAIPDRNTGLFVSAIVGVLSYAFLAAAILKARALSPSRADNFATRLGP